LLRIHVGAVVRVRVSGCGSGVGIGASRARAAIVVCISSRRDSSVGSRLRARSGRGCRRPRREGGAGAYVESLVVPEGFGALSGKCTIVSFGRCAGKCAVKFA
jgi:hypothetical protein